MGTWWHRDAVTWGRHGTRIWRHGPMVAWGGGGMGTRWHGDRGAGASSGASPSPPRAAGGLSRGTPVLPPSHVPPNVPTPVTSSSSPGWTRAPRRSSGSRAASLRGDGDGRERDPRHVCVCVPPPLSLGDRGGTGEGGGCHVPPMAQGSSWRGARRHGSRYTSKSRCRWLSSSPAGTGTRLRRHHRPKPPVPCVCPPPPHVPPRT